jgi:hypothetical protein
MPAKPLAPEWKSLFPVRSLIPGAATGSVAVGPAVILRVQRAWDKWKNRQKRNFHPLRHSAAGSMPCIVSAQMRIPRNKPILQLSPDAPAKGRHLTGELHRFLILACLAELPVAHLCNVRI